MSRQQVWKVIGLTLLVCGLQLSGAQGVTFIPFDIPGSVYIQPQAINPTGVITGFYTDSSGGSHGFVRALDGTINSFDPAGSASTQPQAINPAGTIVGFYNDNDTSSTLHGFILPPGGTFTTLDVPFPDSIGTAARGINPTGEITGYYQDSSFGYHGFLRIP